MEVDLTAVDWSMSTDKTARGGASELIIAKAPEVVTLQGSLGALQGSEGLVGFAIAAFSLPPNLPMEQTTGR